MAIPAMAIMLYRTASIVVIKYWISRILILIVVDLFIIVVVVVMPLMPVVFSCHKVIKMPQQSRKALVDTSNGCLHCPKLGGRWQVAWPPTHQSSHLWPVHQHQFPPFASLPHVPKLEQYPSCEGLWWRVLIIIRRTCHGEVHKTKKKTSEEEQKGLALLGCYCKALTLNLLTRALTSSYLAPQDGEGNQQVSNLEEGVSVLAQESLWSCSGNICGAIGCWK
jgi:hypothetical protein